MGPRAARATTRSRSGSAELQPGTVYRYRFVQGGNRSATGLFKTAPAPTRSQTITFAYSGDTDAQRAQGQSKPFYNNFEVYGRMAAEGNDFNINLGDTIYSDTEVGSDNNAGQFIPAVPTALTLSAKWAKYKQNIKLKNLQRVRGSTGFYSHWDDHEFINDFSKAENGSVYSAGVRAFRDYSPVRYTSRDGLYRSFRWGKNLEMFFLDERSFRDPKASQGGTCNNPQTNAPDFAPTAPQSTRNTFSIIAPSLSQPVSQACKDRIADPNRTFLGRRQMDRFKAAIEKSNASFKVIMNETPIQQYYILPYDRWEGYEAERQELLRFLRDRVKNTVFLTTDTHGNLVNDARLSTLEPQGVQNTGILEAVTGPVATMTFDKEIDDALDRPGSGELARALFLKRQPPDGVGMRCAATNVYSYGEVKVTSKALTITPKDMNGKLVREPGQNNQPGEPCGPFTIAKK